MSRLYETMYILRPDLGEDAVDRAITKYSDLLKEQGAENLKIQHRGKRRLAYEIQRCREGVYIQMNYEHPNGSAIAPLERVMRLSDEVIRYLTLVVEPPKPEEEAEPAAVAEA